MNLNMFKKKGKQQYYPVKDISIVEMKGAVREFALNKREGVNLSVIIEEDNSINIDYLKPYLKCIPSKPFYMSKETYEIFEEEEKEIAIFSDKIQVAVDKYIEETGELPIVLHNPYHKISIKKISDYLDEAPDMDFYLTDLENLISHRKPVISKKNQKKAS